MLLYTVPLSATLPLCSQNPTSPITPRFLCHTCLAVNISMFRIHSFLLFGPISAAVANAATSHIVLPDTPRTYPFSTSPSFVSLPRLSGCGGTIQVPGDSIPIQRATIRLNCDYRLLRFIAIPIHDLFPPYCVTNKQSAVMIYSDQ